MTTPTEQSIRKACEEAGVDPADPFVSAAAYIFMQIRAEAAEAENVKLREHAETLNGQLQRMVDRWEALTARNKVLREALKWRPSRSDYDSLRAYDDAVRNWDNAARAALGGEHE